MRQTKIETITVKTAKALLERNLERNRSVAASHVDYLSSQIRNGHWDPQIGVICISDRGELLDGQHRLLAIIDSNTAVKCNVARGVPHDSFRVIDTGQMRSAANLLTMEGYKDTLLLAAIAGKWQLLLRMQPERGPLPDPDPNFVVGRKVDRNRLVALLEQRPELVSTAALVRGWHLPKKTILPAWSGALFMAFSMHADRDAALVFWEKISTGVDLKQTDPVWVLRDRLQRSAEGRVSHSTDITTRTAPNAVIRTWNYHITGAPMKWLQVKARGATEHIPGGLQILGPSGNVRHYSVRYSRKKAVAKTAS